MSRIVVSLFFLFSCVTSAPPTVKLDDATFIGFNAGLNVRFLGIPFAKPPVGALRLQLPQAISYFSGVINATSFGNQCIQQTIITPNVPSNFPPEVEAFIAPTAAPPDVPQSEDCAACSGLNTNVVVPAGAKPGDNFPVAVVRGYVIGSNAVQPGETIVNRSIELGQPVIFVSMNYRCIRSELNVPTAFGFLGGSDIQQAELGNLGLQDQREALCWVQKHIAAFGATHPNFGESAGSQAVLFQMVSSAGWKESGSVLPTDDFENPQPSFNLIVSETGCAGAKDSLACLRRVSAEAIYAAMDKTPTFLFPQALNTPWMPHTDGVFLKDDPQKLVLDGSIANTPFVVGSCEDEGTLFSLAPLNITGTATQLAAVLKSNYFPAASDADIQRLLELYPADRAAGSPFGTGDANAFTPGYKRLAAFQGDFIFRAPARFLLEQRASKQVARSFREIPGFGATHTTELSNIFGGGDLADFFVRFVNTLDPSGDGALDWPVYTTAAPLVIALQEGAGVPPLALVKDTFRREATAFVTQLGLAHPL
ncbi:carotenoid ester lipase precursor [Epithele typhae]|uniref:carotenoid ester lipase precursor n=1 Tax=Epithele typhae TaxID=378194 RepID=UPI00200833B1|nr:carotenoid ester lipase precursor [Epithele typhae]KAH9908241.1 carotenoid ester lipase precursor [Epithele typhae]